MSFRKSIFLVTKQDTAMRGVPWVWGFVHCYEWVDPEVLWGVYSQQFCSSRHLEHVRRVVITPSRNQRRLLLLRSVKKVGILRDLAGRSGRLLRNARRTERHS